MSEWKGVPSDIKPFHGFVYCITNKIDGRKYIGKKFFWRTKKLPPLKGRKNKRHVQVESDWRDYWGSCPALLRDIEALGKENFEREIIQVCDSKFDCAYREMCFPVTIFTISSLEC